MVGVGFLCCFPDIPCLPPNGTAAWKLWFVGGRSIAVFTLGFLRWGEGTLPFPKCQNKTALLCNANTCTWGPGLCPEVFSVFRKGFLILCWGYIPSLPISLSTWAWGIRKIFLVQLLHIWLIGIILIPVKKSLHLVFPRQFCSLFLCPWHGLWTMSWWAFWGVTL